MRRATSHSIEPSHVIMCERGSQQLWDKFNVPALERLAWSGRAHEPATSDKCAAIETKKRSPHGSRCRNVEAQTPPGIGTPGPVLPGVASNQRLGSSILAVTIRKSMLARAAVKTCRVSRESLRATCAAVGTKLIEPVSLYGMGLAKVQEIHCCAISCQARRFTAESYTTNEADQDSAALLRRQLSFAPAATASLESLNAIPA
eukprot:4253402-Amphidinium_carterae.2